MSAKYKEATYTVVETLNNAIEIREYAPQLVAEVTESGSREVAANRGFRQLFNYISGDNHQNQSMAMTTPVAEFSKNKTEGQTIAMTTPVTEVEDQTGWTIRFFLPSSYTLETIPKPLNRNVIISEVQPRKMAVIQFSGFGNDKALKKQESLLRAHLKDRGLLTAETPEFAFYNAPFTLPFLRRNEVMLPLQ